MHEDMAVTIHITQEDIDKGERGSCVMCPLARALRRCLKPKSPRSFPGVLVGAPRPGYIGTWGGPFKMPEKVAQFVRDFDAGKPVEPFSFPWPPHDPV